MEWTIGSRIKTRNKERLQEVKKRKPTDAEASVSTRRKRRRKSRPKDNDSEVEDVTDTYNNNLPPAEVTDNNNNQDQDSEVEDITDTYNTNLPAAEVAENNNLPAEVTDNNNNNQDNDSEVEDITETYNNNLHAAEVTENNNLPAEVVNKTDLPGVEPEPVIREIEEVVNKTDLPSAEPEQVIMEIEENMERLFRDRVLDVDKSVPGSSGLSIKEKLSDVSKAVPTSPLLSVKEKLCEENLDLDVVKSAPRFSELSIKENLSDDGLDLGVVKSAPSSSELSIMEKLSNEILDVVNSAPSSSGLSIKENLVEENMDLDVVIPVPKLSDECLDLDVIKSATRSSGSRQGSEQNTCVKDKGSSEIRGLEGQKSVSAEVQIISDSESETKARASAKKKLSFEDSESEEDGASNDNNPKDDITVESLSSSSSSPSSSSSSPSPSPSSSSSSYSSDDDSSSKELVGDTDGDDDDLRKASSPVRKVSKVVRKPLGRYKRTGPCSIKPRKQVQKVQKLNHREEEDSFQARPTTKFKRIQKFNRQEEENRLQTKTRNEAKKFNRREEEDSFQARPTTKFKRIQKCNRQEEEENRFQTKPRNEDKKFNRREEEEDRLQARPITEFKRIQKFNRQEEEDKFQTKRSTEEKMIQKFNPPEEERQVEVERVTKQHAVFNCTHCGKENTCIPDSHSSFIIPHASTRAEDDLNNFVSTNVSKYDAINYEKAFEKPSTSRLEIEDPETGKEVITPARLSTSRPDIVNSVKPKEIQAPEIQNSLKAKGFPDNNILASRMPAVPVTVAQGLNASALVNEPMDIESDSSTSSDDESGYDSEPSLKDKEVTPINNTGWRMMDGSRREVDLFSLLVNSVWEKDRLGEEELDVDDKLVSSPEDQSEEQDVRKYDDDGLLIIRPPPLIERFGVVEPQPPPMKSEWEIEEDNMWEEMNSLLKAKDVELQLHSEIEKEILTVESPRTACKNGNHELCLDLEIGMKCRHCSKVLIEIRGLDVSEWGERNTSRRRKIDRSEEEGQNSSCIGKLEFEAPGKSKEGCVSTEGTVWDKIPGVKSQMYPHQQEGFEFIWRNLAGTIMLNELKDFENSDETGGCIMSHAPGTGKTRLTIIFLQSYLECFPDCKPVIIAPASLLLTWAEEFKKWNISIPFHNLSSLDFTGKENSAASRLLMQKNSSARTNNEIRMVKIYSWIKSKSILGISYNLYEKLAGVKDDDKKTKTTKPDDKELDDIREILMGMPGLLVLDEAHTPRNQRSCIWKTLSKVETQKRILLSGTPFQNNFQELCNVLGLARPKYLERLTATLKKSGMTVAKRGKRALGDEINNRGIEELKVVMLPFVHVHKGSILQKSLPGLRECVVVLNPPELQKRVLESIEVTHNKKIKNVFETEHKLSLVSVHPSLVSHCKLTPKERLTIDAALLSQLKKVRMDPNQSVKTRFLMKFIKLCARIEEKVLVFSQYIDPLKLIMEHIVNLTKYGWKEGEEVLYMHGKLDQKQRQTLINVFNDPTSKAKVLLASTKACSEGINLVGASRVILLDVVWNPAVERQAISRAYRIGQKRIVYTYHLVAKGTPEGPKYCKQAQKDRISELVFACSSRPDKGKEKIAEAVTEDKVLDSMVQHLEFADMFDNLIVQPKEADLVEGFSILMP